MSRDTQTATPPSIGCARPPAPRPSPAAARPFASRRRRVASAVPRDEWSVRPSVGRIAARVVATTKRIRSTSTVPIAASCLRVSHHLNWGRVCRMKLLLLLQHPQGKMPMLSRQRHVNTRSRMSRRSIKPYRNLGHAEYQGRTQAMSESLKLWMTHLSREQKGSRASIHTASRLKQMKMTKLWLMLWIPM